MASEEKIELAEIAGDVFHFAEVTSTQDIARDFIEHGKSLPFVVIADSQTKGRGRFGRHWNSPIGGTYFSWATFRPWQSGITIIVSLALQRAIHAITGRKTMIKWPNDILWEMKKLGGILAEVERNTIIIGIGINTFGYDLMPASLLAHACTIPLGQDKQERLIRKFFEILTPIMKEFLKNGIANFIQEYIDASIPIGSEIAVSASNGKIDGHFEGITESGGLLLRIRDEIMEFQSGETILLNLANRT